jgi:hypothetical protein
MLRILAAPRPVRYSARATPTPEPAALGCGLLLSRAASPCQSSGRSVVRLAPLRGCPSGDIGARADRHRGLVFRDAGDPHVRWGQKADLWPRMTDVCFTENGHGQTVHEGTSILATASHSATFCIARVTEDNHIYLAGKGAPSIAMSYPDIARPGAILRRTDSRSRVLVGTGVNDVAPGDRTPFGAYAYRGRDRAALRMRASFNLCAEPGL